MQTCKLYKSSAAAMKSSLGYSLMPGLAAALVIYYTPDSARNVWLYLPAGIAILFSIFSLLNTLVVFRQKLWLDDHEIQLASLFCTLRMSWDDITSATLRERQNAVSRTDRLLVLRSHEKVLLVSLSILSPEDEEEALQKIRSKIAVVVQRDAAAL